jgi:hypothetical protein
MLHAPDVGDPAPDFVLPSTDGPVSLAERLREGLALQPKLHPRIAVRRVPRARRQRRPFEEA